MNMNNPYPVGSRYNPKQFQRLPKNMHGRRLVKRRVIGKLRYKWRKHNTWDTHKCSLCFVFFKGHFYNPTKSKGFRKSGDAYEGYWMPVCPDCFKKLPLLSESEYLETKTK